VIFLNVQKNHCLDGIEDINKIKLLRYNRKPISYKITKKQVKYALEMLNSN
jgi:hypothetical protein